MMKKVAALLLVGMMVLGSVAYAAGPSWMRPEDAAVLEDIQGFFYEYDEMDDVVYVYPPESALIDYVAEDGVLMPKLATIYENIVYEFTIGSNSKFLDTITGMLVLVDGVRYECQILPENQAPGLYVMNMGVVGAEMVRAIAASHDPVKVRLYYDAGRVDFTLTSKQVAGVKTLLEAYEKIDGFGQEIIPFIDQVDRITVR